MLYYNGMSFRDNALMWHFATKQFSI